MPAQRDSPKQPRHFFSAMAVLGSPRRKHRYRAAAHTTAKPVRRSRHQVPPPRSTIRSQELTAPRFLLPLTDHEDSQCRSRSHAVAIHGRTRLQPSTTIQSVGVEAGKVAWKTYPNPRRGNSQKSPRHPTMTPRGSSSVYAKRRRGRRWPSSSHRGGEFGTGLHTQLGFTPRATTSVRHQAPTSTQRDISVLSAQPQSSPHEDTARCGARLRSSEALSWLRRRCDCDLNQLTAISIFSLLSDEHAMMATTWRSCGQGAADVPFIFRT